MACKMLIPVLLLLTNANFALSQTDKNDDKYYSQTLSIGKNASLKDVAKIVDNWDLVHEAMLTSGKGDCFAKTVTLKDLLIIDTEPTSRLSAYDSNIKHGLKQEDILKIYGMVFKDSCTNENDQPQWAIAETKIGFKVVDYLLIQE